MNENSNISYFVDEYKTIKSITSDSLYFKDIPEPTPKKVNAH